MYSSFILLTHYVVREEWEGREGKRGRKEVYLFIGEG